MKNEQRMKIAQDFISLHEELMQMDWIGNLIDTYSKMESGVYGESHEEDGEFWIEIGKHDSKTGNPVIFEWSSK